MLFQLENGLAAALYEPKSAMKFKQLKRVYGDNLYFKHAPLFIVKVKIENETVDIVYWEEFISSRYVLPKLKNEIEHAIQCSSFMIYNGVAYPLSSPTHAVLARAILQKTKPGLATLITP
jgi:hypothetical protein